MSDRPPGHAPFVWTVFRYAVLLLWALICVFPFYWVAITSVKSSMDVAEGPRYLPFVDFAPSFDGWAFILFNSQDRLVNQFLNSVMVATAATAIAVICASMATYALTRFSFHFPQNPWNSRKPASANNMLWFAAVASRILPPIAILIPMYSFAERHGMLDTHWLLILIYAAVNLPVAMWLLRPVFGERAREIEEAAYLDGATHIEILFTILLPTLLRGLFATTFLIFLLNWNEYLFAEYLAGFHSMTLPPWLVSQISAREAQAVAEEDEIIRLSAAIVVMVIPLLILAGGAQAAIRNRFSGGQSG